MTDEPAREMHVIPVPAGWSIEQAWEAIGRGDRLEHPHPPAWAGIEVDPATGHLLKVIVPAQEPT